MHGQHQNADVRVALEDAPGGGCPVETGHRQVGEHDVGLGLFDKRYEFLAVGGVADDLELRGGGERGTQAVAEHRVVVGEDDTYWAAHFGCSGSEAVMVVPRSSLSTVRAPPRISARCRMEVIPTPGLSAVPGVCRRPRPSSITRTRSVRSSATSSTVACVAPACLTTLVSASCAIR